jgi:hypothetical protein
VWNNEDAAVAAAHSVDPGRWWTFFGEVRDRIAARFTRHEPRRHAAGLMLGLLADLGRKNCWTLAEHRGDTSPDALQHLLSRAVWTPTGCAMICASSSPTTWATPTRFWWSTRPVT